MSEEPNAPGSKRDRVALAMMACGSLVGGIAMLYAQLRAPWNTVGQSIFTTVAVLLLVAGVWSMVLNVRNRLAQDGIARVPMTQPWRVAEMGSWFVGVLMLLLAFFLIPVVISSPSAYYVGNLIATISWGVCAVGAGLLLRQMRLQFDKQWTPPEQD